MAAALAERAMAMVSSATPNRPGSTTARQCGGAQPKREGASWVVRRQERLKRSLESIRVASDAGDSPRGGEQSGRRIETNAKVGESGCYRTLRVNRLHAGKWIFRPFVWQRVVRGEPAKRTRRVPLPLRAWKGPQSAPV